jgi:hypothetical protein
MRKLLVAVLSLSISMGTFTSIDKVEVEKKEIASDPGGGFGTTPTKVDPGGGFGYNEYIQIEPDSFTDPGGGMG